MWIPNGANVVLEFAYLHQPIDFFVKKVLTRVVSKVGDDAPPHVKDQAEKLENEIGQIVYEEMVRAVMADRHQIATALKKHKLLQAAALIESL